VLLLKRVIGIVFGAALLVSLVLGGSAFAKEEKTARVYLIPSRDSGESGKSIRMDLGGKVTHAAPAKSGC
jgi:hypothetical protein